MKKFLIILFSIAFIIGCNNSDKTGIIVDTSKGIEQFAGKYEGDNLNTEKPKASVEIKQDGSMIITVNYNEDGSSNPHIVPAEEIRYVGGSKYEFLDVQYSGIYVIEFFTNSIKLNYGSKEHTLTLYKIN
ncbi:hypothetical protein [Brachyspira sp.]|uniref:hypothetical protein n=1 Tax=Brachyspira sp. TaxID=1977261 RepID=UPI002615E37C|nr:hypothetical protein [Brachyspira sp.]